MSESGGGLDLRSLDDEELTKQIGDDLYDGLKDEVVEGVHILLERGWAPYKVLTEALVAGMTIVGIDFRDGILFVPEVLLAANAMKGGMAILRPLLAETGAPPSGKMVIGTVKGDIHDIGKNLVGMMMEGAGFEVIDLGINCDVDKYLNALEEHKPDILGMSALLTTTMPYMKVVIDTLKEKGIRNDYVVLVGGAPLNEAFANSIGADAPVAVHHLGDAEVGGDRHQGQRLVLAEATRCHQEMPHLAESVAHGLVDGRVLVDILLRGRAELGQVVGEAEAVHDPLLRGLEQRVLQVLQDGAGDLPGLVQDHLEHARERALDRR